MFLHPYIFVLGAAAAGLPLVVHWLTRPRPTRLPLSTIRFVQQALEQRRARHRLRDTVILGLRALAVVLIAAAIARPLITQNATTRADEASVSTLRVVILDVSQSMAAQTAGVTALERGRALAARQLQFEPGLRANLLLAAAQPRAVFAGPSNNLTALHEALASAAVRPERLKVQPALNLAGEMLAVRGQPADRLELVIVSDFQRTNWASTDFASLPKGTSIRLQSVAAEEQSGNLALVQITGGGRGSAGGEYRLNVEVGNFSAATRNVRVGLRLGEAAYELTGAVAPWSRETLRATVQIPRQGWHTGEARIIANDDALPADDVRPCVLEVPPAPHILLLTRQSPEQRPSSSYYLERAWVPSEAAASDGLRITRLAPDKLDNEHITAADLVVIDHPGTLSAETIGVLAALVRRGRGLLYVAAETSDAVNLKLLSDALSSSLKLPVEFQPAATLRARRDLAIASVRGDQPPLAIFGGELNSLMAPLRFSGGLATRRLTQGLQDDVRATLSDGSALLVATASDAGSLAVINADLEHSSLPVSPLFVPLVHELTQELLGKKRSTSEFASGEPLAVSIPISGDQTTDLSIHGGPSAQGERGEIIFEASGPLWKSPAAGPPGVYEVRRGDQPVAGVAVVVPAEEGDLRTLSADVLEGRLAGGRDVRFHAWSPEEGEEKDQLWAWLAAGCLLCVLGELAALRLFRT